MKRSDVNTDEPQTLAAFQTGWQPSKKHGKKVGQRCHGHLAALENAGRTEAGQLATDHGPRTTDHGPRTTDHGPLSRRLPLWRTNAYYMELAKGMPK